MKGIVLTISKVIVQGLNDYTCSQEVRTAVSCLLLIETENQRACKNFKK